MLPPWLRAKRVPLIEDNKLDLSVLSPHLITIIKACIGKLDREDFGTTELEQTETLFKELPGEPCQILTKGKFDNYGGPIEKLKVLPPNHKRK